MYLSLLKLNPHSRQVQNELTNPYEMHRTIMRAFPDGYKRDAAGVLFRMEAESHSGLPCLLVQSTMEPNWNAMHPGYLVEPDSARQAVKPFELHVQAGQDLSFRLCANPTVKSAGKRWGLHSQEEQRQWLERKGIESGFCVQQVTIHQLDVATGTIHRETWSHDLNLLAVRFDGMLQVVDALLLCAAVAHGIGSGKVFGFGLLSLARSVPR